VAAPAAAAVAGGGGSASVHARDRLSRRTRTRPTGAAH